MQRFLLTFLSGLFIFMMLAYSLITVSQTQAAFHVNLNFNNHYSQYVSNVPRHWSFVYSCDGKSPIDQYDIFLFDTRGNYQQEYVNKAKLICDNQPHAINFNLHYNHGVQVAVSRHMEYAYLQY